MLDWNILDEQEVVWPFAEVQALLERRLLQHARSGDGSDGIDCNAPREEEPMTHEPPDVGRYARVRLLCDHDGQPALVVTGDVATDAVGELVLRGRAFLAQVPCEIVHNEHAAAEAEELAREVDTEQTM